MKYLLFAAVQIACWLLLSALTHAAPVTFRFEGVIKPLPLFNADLGLPFVLQEGEIVKGEIVFDENLGSVMPNTNIATAFQPHTMQFGIENSSFGIQSYLATAIDESVILDHETYSGPAEFLTVECYPHITSCASGTIPTSSGPVSVFGGLNFAGIPEIMSTPSFSNDVAYWNAFQLRRNLRLVFVSNDGLSSALFDADVNNFYVVPEPASSVLIILVLSFCTIKRKCN